MCKQYDPAREFLQSYRAAHFHALRCKRKTAMLRARCESTTKELSGMPGGGGGDKRQDAALIALAESSKFYSEALAEANAQMLAVEQFIERIPNDTLQMVLLLRYVDMLPWDKLIRRMAEVGLPYSDRQIYRLHGRGLQAARKLWEEEHREEDG